MRRWDNDFGGIRLPSELSAIAACVPMTFVLCAHWALIFNED